MSTVETFECIGCEGRGEVYSGFREADTGAPIGVTCPFCSGTGSVTFEQVFCDMCEQVTVYDAICPHRSSNLCPDCSVEVCGDCRSIAPYADDEQPAVGLWLGEAS